MNKMVIAFWSSFRHQSGVTACVAVMGAVWSLLYAEEVVLSSNHISSSGLFERLRGGTERWEKLEKKEYCFLYGEPEYYRLLYGSRMKAEVILNYGIKYVPMGENDDTEMFGTGGAQFVKKYREETGCLMMDTACGCSRCSQKIVREADLTVIALPSERELIDDFFRTEDVLRKEGFFILCKYKETSTCTPEYLTQRYKIPKEHIGVIPYNFECEQAMREGTTLAFVAGNIHCSKQSSSYRFIFEAKKTARRLRKYVMRRRERLC